MGYSILSGKKILPIMEAFRNQDFNSSPGGPFDYDDFLYTMSLEEYNKWVTSDTFKSSEAWIKILDEIIFALKWTIYGDWAEIIHDMRAKKLIIDYFGEDPYEEKEEYLTVTYWYKKKGENLCCYTSTSDTKYKESDGYILVREEKKYCNEKLVNLAQKRAVKGFELLGKYFLDFWD